MRVPQSLYARSRFSPPTTTGIHRRRVYCAVRGDLCQACHHRSAHRGAEGNQLFADPNLFESPSDSCQALSGLMTSHAAPPSSAMEAAVTKDISHPKWAAISGVSEAVQAPPACPPMFMIAETTPTFSPAISAETAQKALCAMYRTPAPQARISPPAAAL